MLYRAQVTQGARPFDTLLLLDASLWKESLCCFPRI